MRAALSETDLEIALLGPGGVGGLIAAVLSASSVDVLVIATEATREVLDQRGLRLSSVRFGELTVHPRVSSTLDCPVDLLVAATKATGLAAALDRVRAPVRVVLPLLNGIDHIEYLRRRFPSSTVLAGAIRVESDRPEPGVIKHTSPFLRVDIAGGGAFDSDAERVASLLRSCGLPCRVDPSEADVMWGKLVRLNALACMTSAYDLSLGAIRDAPRLRAELVAAVEEACTVAKAEGADVEPAVPLRELEAAHRGLGSSMQRDIAAGREPELDAIAGAVLRAAARHQIACPTIERLAGIVALRAGTAVPAASSADHRPF